MISLTILRILSNNQTLSKRSSLILESVFKDKTVTETKGDLCSSKSICTFNVNSYGLTCFQVHPDFEIPKEYIPELYTIEQKNHKQYYKFGPSSRFYKMCNDFKNVKGYIETWTNSHGLIHREDGYAVTVSDLSGRILNEESFIDGIRNDVIGRPGVVDRGNYYDLKDIIEKDEEKSGQTSDTKQITKKLYALKKHYSRCVGYRKDRKSISFEVRKGEAIFEFQHCQIHFIITNDCKIKQKISFNEVMEMIEDFGNYDSDGNDMSDRFIRDYRRQRR